MARTFSKTANMKIVSNSNQSRPKSNNGFWTFGLLAQGIARAARNPGLSDRIVKNSPSIISTEGEGTSGGFLVGPEHATPIITRIMDNSFLGMTRRIYFSSGWGAQIPVDVEAPWSTSGLQTYWKSEASQRTQTKPKLGMNELKFCKLTCMVPATNELIEDYPEVLSDYLTQAVADRFAYKINLSLIQGSGVGECTGALSCGSLIEVPAGSGQSADTLLWENVAAIWARLLDTSEDTAVWVCNKSTYAQLLSMSFEGTSSSVPHGMIGSENGKITLMGRPVYSSQCMNELGDRGDILLADWSQYTTILRADVVQEALSLHIFFDFDSGCFKFTMRLNGAPTYGAAVSPRAGSDSLSSFITLAERA